MNNKNILYLLFFLVGQAIDAKSILTQNQSSDLNKFARKYGTDKSSEWHNYVPIYDFYFRHLRNEKIKFLEIGLHQGRSARMWEDYFNNATLFFLENDNGYINYCRNILSRRSHVHNVDQGNAQALKSFIDTVKGDFDIIIDDGGHYVNQQITSFKVLFPFLKSGGVYVIEDLFTSFLKEYGGNGTLDNPLAGEQTTLRFLQRLVDDVNYVPSRNRHASMHVCPKHILDDLTYYQKHIEAVHFYSNMCFIFKR